MKVLMTGGGTGGHVYPAIAIANTIRTRFPKAEIAFVGTPKGIENRICQKEGFKIFHVNVMGIRRSLSPSNVKALYLAAVSPMRAKRIISGYKPDVVIGTGGYVCWPICVAAARMGIPTVLHESNVLPGLAVRKLQDKVDKILLNFEDSKKYLKGDSADKTVTVGNPLRGEFSTVTRDEARAKLGIYDREKKIILSYGGSRGAGKINETMVEFMRRYAPKHPNVLHIHATGDIGGAKFKEKFGEYGLDRLENLQIYDYIDDMPIKMAAADLVICRAGAMTVSEIAMMKKAAIFIPSPNVAENHQFKNAKLLADKDAAVVLEEKDLTVERLGREIESLLNDNTRRERIANNAGGFANPNANNAIYEEIVGLIRKRTW